MVESVGAGDRPVPVLRSWWRRLYWLRRDFRSLCRLALRGPAVFAGFGGIGDELLATTVIRELRIRTHRRVTVLARHPELFLHNADVRRILPANPVVLQTADTWHLDVRRPFGWQRDLDDDRQEVPRRHIIVEKAAACGLRGKLALQPYLSFSPSELEQAAGPADGQIAIHSCGATARWHFANKDWGVPRFQEVVDRLRTDFRFVQLGDASDPLLNGVLDRRGLGLRASASILARAGLFVGQVGMLMHLARAVGCRSVIVFGGRERPDQSGYPCNENLYSAVPCAPCWRKNGCDFDRVCLSRITPADVVRAVHRTYARRHQPLETDTVEV